MAPSPENDNTPKAPDKVEKNKNNKQSQDNNKTLSNLNDGELKLLLDEAINYRNPSDREGKSELFQDLLSEAVETERNARAASAGGSELVRYCNSSARRSRHRRKPNSISENSMHGGSLDNLAKPPKESRFEVAFDFKPAKVSTRPREGGSLPSNVNSGNIVYYDPQFFEEAKRNKLMRESKYQPLNMETKSLLEHEHSSSHQAQNFSMLEVVGTVPPVPTKFTSKVTLQVTDIDEPLHLPLKFSELEDNLLGKEVVHVDQIQTKMIPTQHTIFPSFMENMKKVDENGNALHQNLSGGANKPKKKKILSNKNETVVAAEKVEGHRFDIIHDMDKLLEYIGERPDQNAGGCKVRSNVHKSKLHKHTSEDGGSTRGGKKQRAHSSKGKESRSELKKSNSLGEISTTKLEDFAFSNEAEAVESSQVVTLRTNKASGTDKPRERRSWGDVESSPIQNLYKNPSLENLETADFRIVTKKKKTRKHRSSLSGTRRKSNQTSGLSKHSSSNRAESPDPRRKSACSVPHSEKSDSSDVDSVHSLPIDTNRLNSSLRSEDDAISAPTSYAAIARTTDKSFKEKKTSNISEKQQSVPNSKETSPVLQKPSTDGADLSKVDCRSKTSPTSSKSTDFVPEKQVNVVVVAPSQPTPIVAKILPPDVHNMKNFPAIQNKTHAVVKPLNNNEKPKIGIPASITSSNNNKSQKSTSPCSNVKVAVNNNKNVVKNSGGGVLQAKFNHVIQNSHLNDIQNDLSIIQANERETIQYNAQIMPNNIPDVQTIEKMHFFSQHGVGVLPPHLKSPALVSAVNSPAYNNFILNAQTILPNNADNHQSIASDIESDESAHVSNSMTLTQSSMNHVGVATRNKSNNATTATNRNVKKVFGSGACENFIAGSKNNKNRNSSVDTDNNTNINKQQTLNRVVLSGNHSSNNSVNVSNDISMCNNINNNDNTDDSGANTTDNRCEGFEFMSSPIDGAPAYDRPSVSSPNVVESRTPDRFSTSTCSSTTADCDINTSTNSTSGTQICEISRTRLTNDSGDAYGGDGGGLSVDGNAEGGGDDTIEATSDAAAALVENDERPPPVVILSGVGNKDVSGLEFGFDVNEELLSDDICENFISRYVAPIEYTATSHNHDKIVNFIGLAWEEIDRNQSNGKIMYYTEDL